MIDNLIKSILEQVGVLVERQAPEELIKTLPNGQWELLSKAGGTKYIPMKTPESPHAQSNAMTSRLFHHASAVHEALQPHIDKHIEQFRQAPMKSSTWNPNYKVKETSLEHLHEHPVDVSAHPALQVWGDQLEESTGTRPDLNTIKGTRGALKQYLLNLPRGQIDLGHLNKLREASPLIPKGMSDYDASRTGNEFVAPRGRSATTEDTTANRVLSTSDMEEIINHHIGDAKSLKEIHDKNGGIDAVEAMGRTMGANADPRMYSSLKLHHQVHVDLQDLMRPGSHGAPSTTPEYDAYETAYTTALQDARKKNPTASLEEHHQMASEKVPPFEGEVNAPELDSTYNHSASLRNDEDVDNTYEQMALADHHGNNNAVIRQHRKAHENAVIKRALHHFKQHHKL